jgi:peptidoglycan/LPS O-acetylase OafA/YrhL
MKKPRLAAIEYIRGISMLGVIGIHVGSQYLLNTSANIHLIALFEIVSRFSVPIFFFISAFGLFYNLDIHAPFHYRHFMVRRFRTVIIPYLIWSLFYIIHDGLLYQVGFPSFASLVSLLFFGNAKYQLYFLVILIWFYLLMPLWIYMVRRANLQNLTLLLVLQIIFDYWSSFSTSFNIWLYGLQDPLLKAIFMYRLNYWVMHYVFIFVIGGYLAVHMEGFYRFMQEKRAFIITCFWLSLASLLGFYYHLIWQTGYTPLEAINTAHQLCPAGIFYTLAASLFFFTIFTYQKYPACLNPLLHILGRHSYFAYLVHPVAITYLSIMLQHTGHSMTAPIAVLFYLAVAFLAVMSASLCRRLGQHFPLLNILTIGVYPKKAPKKN